MIKRPSSNCSICENTNRASICSACVNHRLIEFNTSLKSLKTRRDSLYSKLSELLEAKGKADAQKKWRLLQNDKLSNLKNIIQRNKEDITQGKAKIERESRDLKLRYGVLDSARSTLEKIRVEQVEKYFPNLICTQSLGHMAISSERLHKQSVVVKQICKLFPIRRASFDGDVGEYDLICNSRLPKGLDPHSIPSEELAASLGLMVQLLNLVAHNLAAPALHSSGFAGSCSRIWQRNSYWDARPCTRSNEYPLFIPRQNYCSTSVENSWTDKNSSNFGVASMESVRKEARLDSTGSNNSFNYSSASPHSVESHRDLQKGIALLKKSVACLTAYCYNSLHLEVPPEASTFEAFAKLLATLSSSKEVRSVFSLKMASSRSCKQAQQLNKSIWNAHSVISSSILESAHLPRNASYNPATESSNIRKHNDMNGWDLVEHPKYPPPPSQSEDVEHWTRAMFIDAKKK
ncbi:unnamed protein product [Eruca vesicaria subsp. sativa]|uniref:UV radiation resistance protein/autophagy-related protein 14 n=1 Tax=Eruca vesicaria subsp. sativa TaxID=29727 RepID=A0ABC8L3T5_ERUVS|nr:unnamed protein product [Eruca vesicaria subsp. sativa]